MNLLAKMLSHATGKNSKNIKSNYIFYKIVGSNNENEFSLQCINTNALFYSKITDIIYDTDILHGLHPIQSCFIGMEYATYIKTHEVHSQIKKINNEKTNLYSLNRYGSYSLCHQKRNGELCFINTVTNEQFIMDPRQIAFSEKIITEFDATQAFYIGLWAGIKIYTSSKNNKNFLGIKQPHLYLVK